MKIFCNRIIKIPLISPFFKGGLRGILSFSLVLQPYTIMAGEREFAVQPYSGQSGTTSGYGLERIIAQERVQDQAVISMNLPQQMETVSRNISSQLEGQRSVFQNTAQAIKKYRQDTMGKNKKLIGDSIEFKYTLYGDQRKVFTKAGNTSAVSNEQIKDPHGNVTTRNTTDMVYDKDGFMIAWKAQTKDHLGNITITERKDITYTSESKFYGSDNLNAKLLIAGYTETTTDSFGNVTIVERKDMTYDRDGNLTGFTETETDRFGNVTKKIVSGTTYDESKNMTSYHEESFDRHNNKTVRDWWGAIYEENPNYTGKDDLVHQKFRLKEYFEKVTEPETELTTTEHRWGIEYNKYDNMARYKKINTGADDRPVTTEWRGEYDNDNRLVYAREQIEDAFGNISESETWNREYTRDGYIVSYDKKFRDHYGNETAVNWSQGEYNSKRQLMSYMEVYNWDEGTTEREWSAQGEGLGYYTTTAPDKSGNYSGLLRGFQEKVTTSNLVLERAVTGMTYDHFDKETGSRETIHTTGMWYEGKPVDTKREVQNIRINTEVDLVTNRVISYETHVIDEAYDNQDNLIRDVTEIVKRSNIAADGYTEERQTLGKSADGSELDKVTIVTRSDAVYDGLGRVVEYKEKEMSNNLPGLIRNRLTSFIAYDATNRVIGSFDIAKDNTGLRQDTETREVKFNGNNQVVAQKTVTRTRGGEVDYLVTSARTDISYTEFNDTAMYREVATKNIADTVENTLWQAENFNIFGQLTASYEKRRRHGEPLQISLNPPFLKGETGGLSSGKGEGGGDVGLDVTTETQTSGLKYNKVGQMTSVTEIANSSEAADLYRVNTTFNIKYDDFGRRAEFIEERLEQDVNGQDVNARVLVSRYDAVLDREGNLRSYIEDEWTHGYISPLSPLPMGEGVGEGLLDDSELALDLHVTTIRSGIVWHPAGQVSRYHDFISRNDTPYILTFTDWSGTYDKGGRLGDIISDTITTAMDGSGNILDTHYEKTDVKYGRFEEQKTYKEFTSHTAAGPVEDVIRIRNQSATWEARGYNKSGQNIGYKQTTKISDGLGPMTRTEVSERRNATYNGFGRIQSYQDTTTNTGLTIENLALPSNWGVMTIGQREAWLGNYEIVAENTSLFVVAQFIGRRSTAPDKSGNYVLSAIKQLTPTLERSILETLGLQVKLTRDSVVSVDRHDIQYNWLGQTSGYVERGNENGTEYDRNWEATAGDSYNIRGQSNSFKDSTKRSGEGWAFTERVYTSYDGKGQVVAFGDSKTSEADKLTTYVDTSGIEYDALEPLGRKIKEERLVHEYGTIPLASLDKYTSEIVDNYQYNGFDEAVSYRTVRFDGETLSVAGEEIPWYVFDELAAKELLINGEILANELLTVENIEGLTYDSQSRQKGYVMNRWQFGQDTVSGGEGIYYELRLRDTSVRVESGYNDNNQLKTYKEISSSSRDSVQVTATVSDVGYDQYGRRVTHNAINASKGEFLDKKEEVNRLSAEYDELGQVVKSVDETHENGFVTERTSLIKSYDARARVTESNTKTRTTGQSLRTAYYAVEIRSPSPLPLSLRERVGVRVIGPELDGLRIALMLEENDLGSVDDLIKKGLIVSGQVEEMADIVSRSSRSSVVFNTLDQEIAYIETQTSPEETVTESGYRDLRMDTFGRVKGFIVDSHAVKGYEDRMHYLLDDGTSHPITSKELDDLIVASGMSVLDLLASQKVRLVKSETTPARVVTSERFGVEFTRDGLTDSYTEKTSDIEHGLRYQLTDVTITYNTLGETLKQRSIVESEQTDGARTKNNTLMDYKYEKNGRLTGAQGKVNTTTTKYQLKEDGSIDMDNKPPEYVSSAEVLQTHTAVGDQARILTSRTKSKTTYRNLSKREESSSAIYDYGYTGGEILGAFNIEKSKSDDGMGNTSDSLTTNINYLINSETRTGMTVANSKNKNHDLSTKEERAITSFGYDTAGELVATEHDGQGRVTGGTEGFVSYTDWDGYQEKNEAGDKIYDGQSEGAVVQTYDIFDGQARVIETETKEQGFRRGAKMDYTQTITNDYDDHGNRVENSRIVTKGMFEAVQWDITEDRKHDVYGRVIERTVKGFMDDLPQNYTLEILAFNDHDLVTSTLTNGTRSSAMWESLGGVKIYHDVKEDTAYDKFGRTSWRHIYGNIASDKDMKDGNVSGKVNKYTASKFKFDSHDQQTFSHTEGIQPTSTTLMVDTNDTTTYNKRGQADVSRTNGMRDPYLERTTVWYEYDGSGRVVATATEGYSMGETQGNPNARKDRPESETPDAWQKFCYAGSGDPDCSLPPELFQ